MVNAFLSNGRRAAWAHVSRFAWHQRRAQSLPAVLADLALIEYAAQLARTEVVRDMRRDGASWQEIGDALGVSRQAAQQRYRTVTE